MRVDDVLGELFGVLEMAAVAPPECRGSHLVAAPQDRVLAGVALLLLLERQPVFGDREEGLAVEPVNRRGHVPVDVRAIGDQLALVVLPGEREQDAGLDHRKVADAEQRPVGGGQSEP